jgi:hypothetical protein
MNEVDFKNWMADSGMKLKVQRDCISRLKRIERELDHCDIDEQYRNDRCQYLMSVFAKKGNNEEIKKYPHANLPIGKNYMSTYRHSLKQYIMFCDELASRQK